MSEINISSKEQIKTTGHHAVLACVCMLIVAGYWILHPQHHLALKYCGFVFIFPVDEQDVNCWLSISQYKPLVLVENTFLRIC